LTEGGRNEVAPADVRAGFALTGYFLQERVLDPRGAAMPEARRRLVEPGSASLGWSGYFFLTSTVRAPPDADFSVKTTPVRASHRALNVAACEPVAALSKTIGPGSHAVCVMV